MTFLDYTTSDRAPMDKRSNNRPPTIRDVAREAGVSFKTVSRVINNNPSVNEEMRKAVKQAMQALGYRPHRAARALRSNRSYTLALMCARPPHLLEVQREAALQDTPDYMADFLLEMIFGCERGAHASGYHLILEFIDDEGNAVSQVADGLLKESRVDGVLLSPPICDWDHLIKALEDAGTPFVRLMPGTDLDRGLSVMTDDFAAGEEIGNYLIKAGHRQIALVSGLQDHMAAAARYEGLMSAARSHADVRVRVVQGDFSYVSGARAARQLFGGKDVPTAIFAANDAMAAGILTTAAEMGIEVPGEVAVVGFDNATISRLLAPKLSTVHQPVREMAMAGVKMLIEAIGAEQPVEGRSVRLPYKFIERASSLPADRA